MENDTFGGAILAWVKSAKAFLKVQAGTGDNLLAFGTDFDKDDIAVLMEE